MKLAMFSKSLGSMSVAEAGQTIKDLGFAGVDLTVRPGGHIAPDRVGSDLAAAVEVLAKLGLRVPLITTAVTAANEPYAVDIFEAAAKNSIPEIKLGYWRYPRFGDFATQLDLASSKLDDIERLASRTGVRANIHNHSGDNISASLFAVWELIKNRDPAAIGAYVDPGHLVVEGGVSTWKMGLDLLQGRITLIAVKDMVWRNVSDPALRKDRWVPRIAPLDQGVVPWPEVFVYLQQIGFDGWASIHSEYHGDHSKVQKIIDQTRIDMDYLHWAMKLS